MENHPSHCTLSHLGVPFTVTILVKWMTVHPELYAKSIRRTSELYLFIYFIFMIDILLVILRITPLVSLPEKSHGQKSLAGCSPRGDRVGQTEHELHDDGIGISILKNVLHVSFLLSHRGLKLSISTDTLYFPISSSLWLVCILQVCGNTHTPQNPGILESSSITAFPSDHLQLIVKP